MIFQAVEWLMALQLVAIMRLHVVVLQSMQDNLIHFEKRFSKVTK